MSDLVPITEPNDLPEAKKSDTLSKSGLKVQVQEALKKYKDQICASVPKHLDVEVAWGMICSEFRHRPELCACTPLSVIESVERAMSQGLYMGGGDGMAHAYFIPFKNRREETVKCTLMYSYRGLIHLARLGGMPSFSVRLVHEGDQFSFEFGPVDVWSLVPSKDPQRASRPVTHVVFSTVIDGMVVMDVMTAEQVNEHAAKFSQNSHKEDSLWKTNWAAMAMKTIIRRVLQSGRVPLTPKFQELIGESV